MLAGRQDITELPEDVELAPGLGCYWRAWSMLRDDRHYGDYGAVGMIYYRAISQYARDFGIVGVEFDHFLFLLRAMDAEFMTFMHAKATEKRDQDEPDQ